ncbi:RING-H2 finger protein, partial [Endozoicomonas sp. SESOKO4]|uniref:RING finger protein n=1 Tax=Endozoicomonas sp. SESOKO4 TaxID=2828745 RepID=UPI002149261D
MDRINNYFGTEGSYSPPPKRTRMEKAPSCVSNSSSAVVSGKTAMNISAFRDNAFKVENTQIPDENCAVCHESFPHTANIVKTPCEHLFHEHCLNKWLQIGLSARKVKTCPTCRGELGVIRKKLNDFDKLLSQYNGCHSLVSADRAINEWDKAETSHEALYHFVQLCWHNSQTPDDSPYINILRKIIHPVTKAIITHDDRVNSAIFSSNSSRLVSESSNSSSSVNDF